jgi:hypothetical protein
MSSPGRLRASGRRSASRGVTGSGTTRGVRPDPADPARRLDRDGLAFPGFAFPLLGWAILLAVHGVYAFVMKTPEEIMIEREARAAAP